MHYEYLLYEKVGNIVILTMNRPEALNAVNSQLWLEMGTAFEEFSSDSDLRVAILTGAGKKAFCTGTDLKELAAGEHFRTNKMKEWGFAGITKHYISKPIIAAVNGFALGGGTEIALACDLIVASERAVFGLPEVKHGLFAGAGGLLRLPRTIPIKVAMHKILTASSISADEAKTWGLVNEVVSHDEVLSAAIKLAGEIINNAPLAIEASKEIIYRSLDSSINFPPTAWDINDEFIPKVFGSEDAKEGPQAFAEKRKPNWSGR